MCFKKLLFFIFCLFLFRSIKGQQVQESLISFGLIPGLATTGLDPGNYYSKISLNLLSGYQRGTYWLEISGISSLNIDRNYGLQFSGLANITGINLFQGMSPREIQKEIRNGQYAALSGFQVSGLLNFIRGQGSGAQVSAGFNVVQEMMTGAQISGIANFSTMLLTGAQLSLAGNFSEGTTLGIQAGGLINFTKNELAGFQLGTVNLADNIQGKNSIADDHSSAFQVGLFNRARIMNGFQIGLINAGGDCRGTQIGLINFYSTKYKTGKLYGTPVGLLNIGASVTLRYYCDETFPFNIAIGTGNSKNSAIPERTKTKYIMNQFLYRKSEFGKSEFHAFGWMIEKQVYNHPMDPQSPYDEFYFLAAGAGISNVFFKGSNPSLNLLGELRISAGSKISPKIPGIFIIGFVDLNYFQNDHGHSMAPENMSKSFTNGDISNIREIWPGYGIGIQIK